MISESDGAKSVEEVDYENKALLQEHTKAVDYAMFKAGCSSRSLRRVIEPCLKWWKVSKIVVIQHKVEILHHPRRVRMIFTRNIPQPFSTLSSQKPQFSSTFHLSSTMKSYKMGKKPKFRVISQFLELLSYLYTLDIRIQFPEKSSPSFHEFG